jgi:drug/metabolite transporter (DMT)-like permease
MQPPRRVALTLTHLAVLFFGLAGVLGKLTTLPATNIVLGRVCFAGIALAALLAVRRTPLLPRRLADLPALAITGAVLALHWTAFFEAVRLSSVAVALLSFSTFPLFTTALEPMVLRERPRRIEVVAALLILPGMYVVVPTFDLNNTTTLGVAWGLLAGFTFAVLSIWNRRLTRCYPSPLISLYQDGIAAIVLLPTLWFARPTHGINAADVLLLLILGVVCTATAHTLFIEGMRTLTAQTASVIAALEPVWGIVFALLLLGEVPTARTLMGGVFVVGATFLPGLARRDARLQMASRLEAMPPAQRSDGGSHEG